MKTIILGERPVELEQLIERRHAQGLDGFDEVWEGEYHMAPFAHARHGRIDQMVAETLGPLARAAGLVATGPFNLGQPDDFRVPDRGVHRAAPEDVWMATATIVVEILSPDDETDDKFTFYARHGVDEILVFDPDERQVTVFTRDADGYRLAEHSAILGVPVAVLTTGIDWP